MKKYLLFLVIYIFLWGTCYSQTFVSGTINGTVTWDLAGSPYIVTGHITVSQGAELIIKPAVEIKVDTGFGFYINGTIRAIGTPDSNIEFSPYQTSWNREYRGFRFSPTAVDYDYNSGTGSILQYCKFQGPIDAFAGQSCNSTNENAFIISNQACPYIDNCIFYSCRGIINGCTLRSDFYFTNNKILNCTTSFDLFNLSFFYFSVNVTEISCNIISDISANSIFNLHSYSPDSSRHINITNNIIANSEAYYLMNWQGPDNSNLSKNIFYKNYIGSSFTIPDTGRYNTFAYNDYLQVTPGNLLADISNNNFIGVSGNGSYMGTSYCSTAWPPGNPTYQAVNNYWGTTDINDINNLIIDGYDYSNCAFINYQPFLINPDTDAPVSPVNNITRTDLYGNNVQLSWDANPESDIAGYRIYWGGYTGYSFNNYIDVGNVTSWSLTGISFSDSVAITAYDASSTTAGEFCNGHESWFAMPNTFLTGNSFNPSPFLISVTPNPANEFVIISFPFSEDNEIRLTDLSGRILFIKTFTDQSSNYKLQISNYASGIYFVEVSTGKQKTVCKVVKQ